MWTAGGSSGCEWRLLMSGGVVERKIGDAAGAGGGTYVGYDGRCRAGSGWMGSGG